MLDKECGGRIKAFEALFPAWAEAREKHPDTKLTIDRIDNDGHYETSNIQFIPKGENSRKAHLGRKHSKEHRDKVARAQGKSIVQMTKNGKVVARYWSVSEAGRQTDVNIGNISRACRGIYKQTSGFKWKYDVR